MAIGRDKRKEFNALIEPMRARMIDRNGRPKPQGLPSAIEMDRIDSYLWIWQRQRLRMFIRCCAAEAERQEYRTNIGEVLYHDETEMRKYVGNILKILQRR